MKPTKSVPKLSGEERRVAIIRAVRKVFADKGFHGTTTRELADAAGVSEALMFKHFPKKEALYSAMQLSCCHERDPERLDRIKALEPSTSTLAVIVHLMVATTVRQGLDGDEDALIHNRLMLRSLMEDGEFARLFFQRTMPCWVSKVEECLQASIKAGDAFDGPVRPNLGAVFARHLAKTIMLLFLPANSVIDYEVPRNELVEQIAWFTLRGLGVRDEAIKRYYNPKGLAALMG
jgi:AcrR family transcriptional regulator